MYSKTEFQDSSFIDDAEILDSLEEAKKLAKDHGAVRAILDKARECGGLIHREAAVLLGRKRSEPIRKGLIEAGFNEKNIFVVDSLDAAMPILGALGADVTLFENDLPDNYAE